MMTEQELNDDITTFVEMIKNGDDDILNIVIEGKDDRLVYDEFEEIYGLSQPLVTIFPVGGRNTALGIFKALKNTKHINKVIFLLDQDQWVFSGVDPQYIHPHIIFTHGYSFENDIFIDGDLENDMLKKNPTIFSSQHQILLNWYVLELYRIVSGKPPKKLSLDVNELFNNAVKYTTPEPGEILPNTLLPMLVQNYDRILRGKTLLKFYVMIMNNRPHCNKNTYSTVATIENVCKRKGTHLNRIFSEVDHLHKKLTA